MNNDNLIHLQAEVATLEAFLTETPEEEVIERLGIEDRLERARKKLTEAESSPQVVRFPITFRGTPVDESHSIDGKFGAKAIDKFITIADTIVAARRTPGELGARGKLRNSNERSLRIADTALGSFGFLLEAPLAEQQDQKGQQALTGMDKRSEVDERKQALLNFIDLISKADAQDEEGIDKLAAEVGQRSIKSIKSFLEHLRKHDAQFALRVGQRRLTIRDSEQLSTIAEYLDIDDIEETEDELKGSLAGILPDIRNFEANVDSVKQPIRGKVGPEIEDIDAFQKEWLGKPALLQMRIVTVRKSKTYTLLGAKPHQPDGA